MDGIPMERGSFEVVEQMTCTLPPMQIPAFETFLIPEPPEAYVEEYVDIDIDWFVVGVYFDCIMYD